MSRKSYQKKRDARKTQVPAMQGIQATQGLLGVREEIIELSTLIRDAGTQMRVTLDLDVVEEYSEDMSIDSEARAVLNAQGRPWPALRIFEEGNNRWVTDGFHRLRAAERQGLTHFQAVIIPGTLQQAIEDSLKSNQEHGLRRTSEDKRRIVRTYLDLFGEKVSSDRMLARTLKVSPTTVGKVRHELETAGVIEEVNERVGADGRVHDVAARRVPRPSKRLKEKDTHARQENTLSFGALDSTTQVAPSSLVLARPSRPSEYDLLGEHLPRLLAEEGSLVVIPKPGTAMPLAQMSSWTSHEARLVTLYAERNSALVWTGSSLNSPGQKTLRTLVSALEPTSLLTLESDSPET